MARYALVIGVSENYSESLVSITQAQADAEAMAALLEGPGSFRVTRLIGQVTREELTTAFQAFWKQASKGEALVFYSGHGLQVVDDFDPPEVVLAPSDCVVELDGKNRVVAQQNGLKLNSLNRQLARAEFSNLVMLLDCCHSGFLLEQEPLKQTFQVLEGRDYVLLTACRSHETAWADGVSPYSVFTETVLAGLSEAEVDEQGIVTADRLIAFVKEKLRKADQEPVSLGVGRELAIVQYRQSIAAAPAVEVNEECPYQGLNAFTPETRQFFFGREAEVATILRKLDESNFVAVVGPSGIGKSSVVRAGLVPRLEERGWEVLGPMKPGPKPMAELERLFQGLFPERELAAIYELVEAGQLIEVVQQLSDQLEQQKRDGQRFLLVIDQFEEVFTLTKRVEKGDSEAKQEAARQAQLETQRKFIAPLLKVGTLADSPLAIVVTMRSDFVDAWLATGQPTAVVQEQAVYVGPLQGNELDSAIVEPAKQQGYGFGAGLLPLILADVEAEPNSLPLLEFALTQLWERRDGTKQLTAEAYQDLGQLQGGLNSHAEKVYESLSETEQDWARRIFLALARIGKDERDTRQRRTRKELCKMGRNEREREDIEAVVRALSGMEGRLLTADGDEVDLIHEALIGRWERFVEWRQVDRDQLRLRQRAEDAHSEWKEKGKSDIYLMAKGLLEEWRELGAAERTELLGSADLSDFFRLSDEAESKSAAALEEALALAKLREERTRILNLPPTRIVDQSLMTIDLIRRSLGLFSGHIIPPAEDLLKRVWDNIRERLRCEGHSDTIFSVAFSPQGDRILSGSSDKTIRLWNLDGNQLGNPFRGHSGRVWSVAFNPQGDRIISGSSDKTLRLWDLDGNQLGNPFEGHSGNVLSVAFSPQGDRILSGSSDKTIRLWDLDGNQLSTPFEGHSDWVWSVAFNPQGDRIVSGSSDKTLRLWDLDGNQLGNPFEGHSGNVLSVTFSPQGDRIVSGSSDQTLRLWHLDGKPFGNPFESHSGTVWSVAFSPQGDRILSSSDDTTLRLWDIDGNLVGNLFEGHSGTVWSVAFSPQGDRILSGSSDQTLRLWDINGYHIRRRKGCSKSNSFKGHSGNVWSVAFSPQGNRILSGSDDKTLRLWDLNGNQIGNPFDDNSSTPWSVAFSPQGNRILSGNDDKTIHLWDLKGNQINCERACASGNPFKGHSGTVLSATFSPQGNHILSGSDDKTLRLWDLNGNQIGNPFEGHSHWVRSVAFSPRGNLIISGSSDKTLRLWDIAGNQLGNPFEGHAGSVLSVVFSPQGDRILSGSSDKTLRLWDLDGNQLGAPFEGHSGTVWSVAFSPEGAHILSGSDDKTLRLWDIDGNQIGNPFEGHSGNVLSVAFSPQGDRILSSSSDQTLRLWRGGTWQDWLRGCCNHLMFHSSLVAPQTEYAKRACQVCLDRCWTKVEQARFHRAQGYHLQRQGDPAAAQAKFAQAQKLDPSLEIDSQLPQ